MQYTYGIGAIGGGLGRKRLVEFVAFCDEFAPYYRFLHEDTQGNTIATTSLWGDRLDEYDYTDYGVPLHAPVALDGRWIAGIASGATDVSIVTLSESDMLVPNELIGCELRVALEEAGAAKQVFLAGTVISHLGAEVKIHDPGHKIATAWNQTAQGQVHKPSACFYDMREGCYRGVIDSATPGTWLGLPVTFITVGNGAFESWMISSYIQLGSQSAQILMADTPAQAAYPANGFKRLIVQGTGYSGAASGEWYTVIGNCATEDIARSGSWSSPAGCTGGLTTFVLSPHAEVRDEQVGWWLQPDINCQAWFPIVAASESNHTVTIAGDHRALGTVGTRFRIYAPPGVATRGAQAGTLPKFAEAASSRCLYKGYRYETAAAGRWTSQGIAARQGGSNFTGQHYTLFRHFDPSLMRFTSLDPIAASQNLWAYCDNNPHGAYDPDGLSALILADYLFNDGEATQAYWRDLGYVKGRIKQNFTRYEEKGLEEGLKAYGKDVGTASAGYVAGAADSISPHAGNWVSEQFQGMGVDTTGDLFGYGRVVGNVSASVMQMALTGGGCGWAKALSVGLTVSDFGHAGYALATGDITSAVSTLVGQTIGFGAGRLAKGHWICFVEGTLAALLYGASGVMSKAPVEPERASFASGLLRGLARCQNPPGWRWASSNSSAYSV
ncbi:MAG: RHS repeat-associated core domain-containing protein [Planctomycetes bacterium]|nr:RHS repeat-associated core domain-containing protein [Planctomycetota bacterium]